MKKISVIVPIYNTKEELIKCLSSICGQTYRNLEIICIDDGSTDGSEKILDMFAKRDSRIVSIHQENWGESNARNTGLKRATGEYIAFCDCDDWIENTMYETLVNTLEENMVEMVASSWYRDEYIDDAQESVKIQNVLQPVTGIINRPQLLQYLYMRDSYKGFAYMWNKIYKREILQDKQGNLLLFDENLKLGGDVIYLAEAALNVKQAIYIDQAFYHYNQRSSSGCHTEDVNKLKDWLKAYEYVIFRFIEENIDKETIDYVKRFMAYHSSNAAEVAYKLKDRHALRDFQEYMRRFEKEYISLNLQNPDRIDRYIRILDYEI